MPKDGPVGLNGLTALFASSPDGQYHVLHSETCKKAVYTTGAYPQASCVPLGDALESFCSVCLTASDLKIGDHNSAPSHPTAAHIKGLHEHYFNSFKRLEEGAFANTFEIYQELKKLHQQLYFDELEELLGDDGGDAYNTCWNWSESSELRDVMQNLTKVFRALDNQDFIAHFAKMIIPSSSLAKDFQPQIASKFKQFEDEAIKTYQADTSFHLTALSNWEGNEKAIFELFKIGGEGLCVVPGVILDYQRKVNNVRESLALTSELSKRHIEALAVLYKPEEDSAYSSLLTAYEAAALL